jgi:hypothetical protein
MNEPKMPDEKELAEALAWVDGCHDEEKGRYSGAWEADVLAAAYRAMKAKLGECPDCAHFDYAVKMRAEVESLRGELEKWRADWLKTSDDAGRAMTERDALRGELAAVKVKLKHRDKRIDELEQANIRGGNSEVALMDKVTALEAELEKARAELAEAKKKIAELSVCDKTSDPSMCGYKARMDAAEARNAQLVEALKEYRQALLDHAADGCYCYKARPSTAVCQNDCGPANARKLLALLSALSNSSPSWLQEQIEKATGPLKEAIKAQWPCSRCVDANLRGHDGTCPTNATMFQGLRHALAAALNSAPSTDAKDGK